MDERLTPGQAWDGWVGSQTPEEFMRLSAEDGHTTIENAVEAYVKDIPNLFDDVSEVPENLADLLAEFIRTSLNDGYYPA